MTATRVLVVDDEIIIAREVETRLMNLGYEVVEIASSGQEAVDLAERTRPDLVLMDIVLKGDTDGIEAAAEIRKRWGIPIIYLTAYADEVTLRRAQVTEPFGYIVKPFTERELRANIEMALYKHSTEAKLLAIEKWFAASMRQIEDGVVATDAEGRITFMNQVAEVLTGLRSEEVIGRTVNETIPLLCRTPKLVPQIPQEAQNGLIVEVGGDILLRHQGMNEEIPIHLAVTPLRDFHGNAAGAVMVVRDLSERKRADELRRKMAERDLQAQKLEAAGLMAGKIAHQFNNLLSVILGHSLIQLSHEQMSEDFRESLTRIKEAADRAGRLTNQLLAISCRQALEPRVLDLNELVAEMEKEVRQSIGESITLTISQTPDLWKVKVDPGQTKRVIQNLALNARDAMP
jgi:PAS domain S-box-containing protein